MKALVGPRKALLHDCETLRRFVSTAPVCLDRSESRTLNITRISDRLTSGHRHLSQLQSLQATRTGLCSGSGTLTDLGLLLHQTVFKGTFTWQSDVKLHSLFSAFSQTFKCTGCPVKLSTPVFKSNLCLSCNSDLQMEYLLFFVDRNRCKKWSYT